MTGCTITVYLGQISYKKGTNIMNHYEFSVFQKGTFIYLSSWDCDADTEQIAVMKFIHQLSDLNICEDEFEIAIGQSIIEKLAGKEYEVEHCDGYIDIILTLSEEEANRYLS